METPLVTIVIPVFNSELYLYKTLISVKNQLFTDWECILIDDGSQDKSHAIIQEFVESDTRFISNKRAGYIKGVSVCRNIGTRLSSGKYIIYLDSDDLLEDFAIEKRVDFMENNHEIDFAVFQMKAFGLKDFLLTKKKKDYLKAFLSFNFAWQTSCPIWRKDFLKQVGPFNEQLQILEDPELHIRALLLKPVFKVFYDREPDSFYRVNRPFMDDKGTRYHKFFENFSNFFLVADFIEKLNRKQKKWLINGFYLMIIFLIPPFEEFEKQKFTFSITELENRKILTKLSAGISKLFLSCLSRSNSNSLDRVIIYLWAFYIKPERFFKEVIVKKIKKISKFTEGNSDRIGGVS